MMPTLYYSFSLFWSSCQNVVCFVVRSFSAVFIAVREDSSAVRGGRKRKRVPALPLGLSPSASLSEKFSLTLSLTLHLCCSGVQSSPLIIWSRTSPPFTIIVFMWKHCGDFSENHFTKQFCLWYSIVETCVLFTNHP